MKSEENLRAVTELDQLDPQPGEDADLDARRRLMQAAERVREDVTRPFMRLALTAPKGRWATAVGSRALAESEALEASAALARAMGELGEAVNGVERCRIADFDHMS